MKRTLPLRLGRRLFLLLLLASGRPLLAQRWEEDETRWLRLDNLRANVGVEAEGLSETVDFHNSSSSKHDYLSLVPLLGLKVDGSVYHPNLVSFQLDGEGGLGWAQDRVTTGGTTQTRNENQDLLRYLAQVNFLSAKPYTLTFFSSRDHFYRNYDFFNTATVDTERYGGRVVWNTGPLNLSAEGGYREERSSGLGGTAELGETYLNFNALHTRDHGTTSLTYNYDQLNQINNGVGAFGTTHSVYASDSETFGSRKQISATTGAGYNRYDYNGPLTETVNLTENVTVNHLPTLDSFYNALFNRTDQSSTSSSVFQGAAGLRHRLYASLTTTIDAHGVYDDFSNSGASGSNDRYGLSLREDYLKRLGGWGRLTVGGGVIADHEDHDSSGLVLTSFDERHTLFLPSNPGYRPVILNNPRVIQSGIQVFTSTHVPAQLNVDYLVVSRGDLTEIQLVPTSLTLHDGDTILVTYNSESLYTSSFESLNSSVQLRLDLYNTVGIYGRANWLNNDAPANAVVESLTDLVAGSDLTWRFARVGAEYEDYDSNFSRFRSWRFFQALNFQVDPSTHLGFNFNQVLYHYLRDGDETQYSFTSHLDTQLATWLSWYAEGGYFLRDLSNGHQDLAAARTGLTMLWGKLSARAGYQYNYQLTRQIASEEQRDRNYFFVHLRRTF